MATVALVSFRLKSRDGVALETEKWLRILKELGHEPCRVAGYIPDAGEHDYVIPGLNHLDPEVESFTQALFGQGRRDGLTDEFGRLSASVAAGLESLFGRLAPDLVVAGNVFSLPLNLPLSAALCRWLESSGTPCIALHHDFRWDDPGFERPALPELVSAYVPAPLPQILHACMDARGREELYNRSGLAATLVERCLDFGASDAPAPPFRVASSAGRGLLFYLPAGHRDSECRERAIDFLREFRSVSGRAAQLLVERAGVRPGSGQSPGAQGDVIFAGGGSSGPVDSVRHLSLEACDAVIVPGSCRELGNSLLESIVYRKPLLVAEADEADALRARGLQFLVLDGRAAERLASLMEHPDLLAEMVNRNYELGRKHYSLDVLRERVAGLVAPLVDARRGSAGRKRSGTRRQPEPDIV